MWPPPNGRPWPSPSHQPWLLGVGLFNAYMILFLTDTEPGIRGTLRAVCEGIGLAYGVYLAGAICVIGVPGVSPM